jgi:penicillin-binding protein-related factor A (putative recombinase)
LAGEGKQLEKDIEQSAKDQGVFYFRVRDVNPQALKPRYSVPQNKYDCLMFYSGYLFPVEMKSTKSKSISFREEIIKAHQIKSLTEAAKYEKVIPGFIMTFREPENRSFYIHISDFNKYKHIAENKLEHTYKGKLNEKSISISICEEIGTEIVSVKKKVNYRYYINKLCNELIEKYK